MFTRGGSIEHGTVVCHDSLAQSDFGKDVQDIRQQTPGYQDNFTPGLNETLKCGDRLTCHSAIDGQRVIVIRRYGNVSHRYRLEQPACLTLAIS